MIPTKKGHKERDEERKERVGRGKQRRGEREKEAKEMAQ